ncbi:MAG: ArsR/SmtB family transcription factor [Planctomycetota bacterium]
MNRKTRMLFDARAGILKALAHRSRLFIVSRLSSGERCVAEIADMIDADVSTASKHLSILKAAGIIGDEKRGAQVYYTLKVPCVLGFLECVESVMKSSAREMRRLYSSKRA